MLIISQRAECWLSDSSDLLEHLLALHPASVFSFPVLFSDSFALQIVQIQIEERSKSFIVLKESLR